VHHLSLSYPRCRADQSIPDLMEFCGTTAVQGESAQLRILRTMQNGTDN
jgi:hypothetical protein